MRFKSLLKGYIKRVICGITHGLQAGFMKSDNELYGSLFLSALYCHFNPSMGV